jgi:hypothetical protein
MPTANNATYNIVVQGYDYFNYVSGWNCQALAYGTTFGPSQSPGYTVEAPVVEEPAEIPAVSPAYPRKAGK